MSEDDLREAAKRLNRYIHEKKVARSVTLGGVEREGRSDESSQPIEIWRRGRDLNSRMGYPISGFQDRHVRPLRHPSIPCLPRPGAFIDSSWRPEKTPFFLRLSGHHSLSHMGSCSIRRCSGFGKHLPAFSFEEIQTIYPAQRLIRGLGSRL